MTVSVKEGVYSAGIGDTSASGDLLDYNFNDSDTIYLNIEVANSSGGSCASVSSFETLSPRQRIFSSGYAINANTLGGFLPSQSATGSHIPVLSSGNLLLAGTNPQINATGSNALVLQGGGGTGDVRFFNSSNAITSSGILSLASGIIVANATTTNATSTALYASGFSQLQTLTFANASATTLSLTGAFNAASSTVTTLNFTNATGSRLTVTSLAVGGQSACLADGTNCPVSAETDTLASVTQRGASATTTVTLFGGLTVSSITATGTISFIDGAFRSVTGSTFGLTNINVTGSSALQAVTFANASATTLSLTGAFNAASSTVTTLNFTNATGSRLFSAALLGTNVTSTNLAATSLTNCDTIDTDGNGNFKCGSDATGGGSGSSAFVTAVTVTNGSATSIFAADGLAIATSTSNASGLFSVNSSGNVAASGTLRIYSGATSTSMGVTGLTNCDTIDTDANGNLKCGSDAGASSASLQGTYETGNAIVTQSGKDIDFLISAVSTNFTISFATTSNGTVSISRLDGADTAFPTQLLLIQNLDTSDGPLTGLMFNVAAGGLSTAIDVSDADIGTAISIGTNILAITTGTIGSNAGTTVDFVDFDMDNDGKITFTSDNAGDQINITTPANNFQALVVDAATNDSTQTEGMIDLNVDTATNGAIGGVALDFTVRDAASNLTVYGNRNNVTVDSDAGQAHTVYGEYIGLTPNDADSVTYGMAIVAENAGTVSSTVGLLIDNLHTSAVNLTDGILVRATTPGTIPDAIDASDQEITNAINVGDNIIFGTTSTIDFTDFDVSSDGLIVIAPDDGGTGITLTPSAALTIGLDFNSTNIVTDIQFQNDATLDNNTDGDLAFIENSRTLILDFDAVASRIQVTSTSELELASAANSSAAVTIQSTVGGIRIMASNASAGEDIRLDATGSSVYVSSTEAVADAIRLIAADTAGGIDVDSGTGGMTFDTTGGLSLDAANHSNFTVNGSAKSLMLEAIGGGAQTVAIHSSGTTSGAVYIQASAGGIDILATGASAGEDIRLAASGSSVSVSSTEAVADAIRLIAADTAGGIDVDSGTGGMTFDTTGLFSIDASSTSNFTVTNSGQSLNLEAVSGGTQTIAMHSSGTAAGAIYLLASAGGIDILATGAAGGEDINIASTGASVNVTSTEAVIDAINVYASANAGSVAIRAGDNAADIPAEGGNDVYLGAEDDLIFDSLDDVRFTMDDDLNVLLAGGGNFIIDASSTNSTVSATSTGTVQFDIVAAPSSGGHSNGLRLGYTATNDANANQTFVAQFIQLVASTTQAGDTLYGLLIDNASTTSDTAADALLRLNNTDSNTAVGVGLLIDSSGSGGITKAIDINDSDVVTDIEMQNEARIDNNTTGTVMFTVQTVQTSADLLVGNGAGNDSLQFSEESTNPSCAAGDYKIWANSVDGLLKKCQNGASSDLDAAGAWSALTDPTKGLEMSHGETTTTMSWDTSSTAAALNAWIFALTNDATTDNTVQNLVTIRNNNAAGSSLTESLLFLNNADADEAVTAGIVVTSTGAGGITTGLDFDSPNITTDIQFQNDATLDNNTDGDLAFVENSRTFVLDFDAVTSRIQVTSTSELEFASAANSASAVTIKSTVGGIDITAAAASGGEDIDILATGSSVNVTSTEAVADAIRIIASDTAGGIDVDSGTGGMTFDTTGGVSIDAANTSNLTVNASGKNLALEAVGGGTQVLMLNSSGTAAGAIALTASAGGIDIRATGAAAGEDINIIATGSSVNVTSTEAAADAIRFTPSDAAGGILFDGGGTDRTGDLIFIDHDVNSATSSGIYVSSTVGTALSAGETMNALKIDISGLSGDNAASALNGILMTGSTSTGGIIVGLNFAGSFDSVMNFQQSTTTLTFPANGDIVFATGTSPTASDIVTIKERAGVGMINLKAKVSTGNPGGCNVGDMYVNSVDKTAMVCTSQDKWEQMDNPQGNTNTATAEVTLTAAYTRLVSATTTPSFAGNDIWVVGMLQATNTSAAVIEMGTLKLVRGDVCSGTIIGNSVNMAIAAGTATLNNGAVFTVSYVDTGNSATTAQGYSLCANDSDTTVAALTAGRRSVTLYEITNLGVDLAEVYYSRERILPGMVVQIDPSLRAGVKSSSAAYEKGLFGVVSTRPSQVMSEGLREGEPVMVALAGRVPVIVSGANGPIEPGDYLTSSPEPGVAMRATKAGQVLGQALTAFDGKGAGVVSMFVKPGHYGGASSLALFEGLALDGAEQEASDFVLASPVSSQRILDALVIQRPTSSTAGLSEMMTDRLAAGLEMITPRVVADEVRANVLAAGERGLALALPEKTSFVIRDASSTLPLATFDSKGNAVFAGEISARAIRADEIAGLDGLASQLAAIASSTAAVSSTVDDILSRLTQTATAASVSSTIDDMLVRLAQAASSTDAVSARLEGFDERLLKIEQASSLSFKDVSFEGGLTVNGLLTLRGGLSVDRIGSQGGTVEFLSDLVLIGRPYFNADTAGFAVVKRGATQVKVAFEKEYLAMPVINVTPSLDATTSTDAQVLAERELIQSAFFSGNLHWLVTDKSAQGFVIRLNGPAPADLTFNWIALAVKDAKTFFSEAGGSAVEETSAPSPPPAPALEPTPETQTSSSSTQTDAPPASSAELAPLPSEPTTTSVIEPTPTPAESTPPSPESQPAPEPAPPSSSKPPSVSSEPAPSDPLPAT